jgi:hypothetical protein
LFDFLVSAGVWLAGGAQAKLFSAFEQADSFLTRKYGGTGLGLEKDICTWAAGWRVLIGWLCCWVLSAGRGVSFVC